MIPYAGKLEDCLIGDDRKPTAVEHQLDLAETEIARLRVTVRHLEQALRAAAAVLAPYARKVSP
jgi:hypothetical protein